MYKKIELVLFMVFCTLIPITFYFIRISYSEPCNMPVRRLARIFVYPLLFAVEDRYVVENEMRSLLLDQIVVLF